MRLYTKGHYRSPSLHTTGPDDRSRGMLCGLRPSLFPMIPGARHGVMTLICDWHVHVDKQGCVWKFSWWSKGQLALAVGSCLLWAFWIDPRKPSRASAESSPARSPVHVGLYRRMCFQNNGEPVDRFDRFAPTGPIAARSGKKFQVLHLFAPRGEPFRRIQESCFDDDRFSRLLLWRKFYDLVKSYNSQSSLTTGWEFLGFFLVCWRYLPGVSNSIQ